MIGFGDVEWKEVPTGWHDRFLPQGVGEFFDWPPLTDLFPWQYSGVQTKRNWPIGPTDEVLEDRWRALMRAPNRQQLFGESSDRRVTQSYIGNTGGGRAPAIASLGPDAPMPTPVSYGFRVLDRQRLLLDGRLVSRVREPLWEVQGPRQVYLTTLINHPLGTGAALFAAANVPDLHHFRGSFGAKEVIPLFRDATATEANVLPGLLGMLSGILQRRCAVEDFVAYVYAVLSHGGYTRRFWDELESTGPRVPLTRDATLFEEAVRIGRRLLWLHTYGERSVPAGIPAGTAALPRGHARCTRAVPDDSAEYPERFTYHPDTRQLHIGTGIFEPVSAEVWEFEVSGLKVVQSWLGFRMRERSGRISSPLDSIHPRQWTATFTTEFLHLLHIVEATLGEVARQERLLAGIVLAPLLRAADLPPVPDAARRAPPSAEAGMFDDTVGTADDAGLE